MSLEFLLFTVVAGLQAFKRHFEDQLEAYLKKHFSNAFGLSIFGHHKRCREKVICQGKYKDHHRGGRRSVLDTALDATSIAMY